MDWKIQQLQRQALANPIHDPALPAIVRLDDGLAIGLTLNA